MNADDHPRSVSERFLVALLLALMAVLAGGAALRESVTVDEVSHIGAGVSYLQKLDLRMNPEHPPLPKVWAALPLVCRGIRADYNHISWTFSEKFFPAFTGQWVFGESLLERWNEPKTVLAWARLPMLLLSLALGFAIYTYARRLGGKWAGLLCLTVYVSTPAFLTFGPLVHTDLAVTLFSLLALWTFAEVWQEPGRKNAILFGLCLAGALLSKFNAGILFVVLVAFALSLRWLPVSGQLENKAEMRQWRRARWRATIRGVLWAALVVYLFYLVFSWHQPTNALYRIGSGSAALFLRRLLMPLLLYLRGIFFVLITGRRPTFILGHSYPHGVWFYFPVVFALKSPLGYLSLLVLSGVVGLGRKARRGTSVATIPIQLALHWRALWVGLLVFTGVCLLSPLDISIRHFTVPMVLLILMLAPLPRVIGEIRERRPFVSTLGGATVTALATSCLFTAVRAYPFYFPYMNDLSSDHPAYELLNDSNVDWNQSLPEVQRFAKQLGLKQIGVDEYGFSDVTVSIPQARLWNCQAPRPDDAGQWVALSANMILDGHNCAWLRPYLHQPLAGGSMYALRLPTPIPAAGSRGGPPLPSDYRQFGGAPMDIRSFFTYVYQHPEGLPQAVQWMQDTFAASSKSLGAPPKPVKPPWEPN